MDYVGVRRVAPDGEIVGEARMLGLFTTKAYAEPASETPLLHRKLRQILDAEDLIEGSHDYKAAVALFDSFPKDELFAAPVDDLRRAVVALLALEGTDQVRLLGRRDRRRPQRVADRRAARATRYDADAASSALRELFRRALRHRRRSTPTHVLGEGDRVRVHFTVHAAGGLPERRLPRARARGRRARAHVGRRAARRAGRAPRRGARARAAPSAGRRASPSYYKALHRRRRSRSHDVALLRAAATRASRSWSALQNAARRPRRASALYKRGRQGRAVARRCRCSRTSGCA